MTNKKRNILIGIIVALFLLFCFTGYHTLTDQQTISEKNADIKQKELVISKLKTDLNNQGKITDSLKNIASKNDSILKERDKQLKEIKWKYDHIKGAVKILTPEETVAYLKERLTDLVNEPYLKYPILAEYDNSTVVILDTTEARVINLVFVELDETMALLDTTTIAYEEALMQIDVLYEVIGSQDIEISLCKEITNNQDSIISDQKYIINEQDGTIDKLEKKNKIKNTAIKVLGGVSAVLGIIVLLN